MLIGNSVRVSLSHGRFRKIWVRLVYELDDGPISIAVTCRILTVSTTGRYERFSPVSGPAPRLRQRARRGRAPRG